MSASFSGTASISAANVRAATAWLQAQGVKQPEAMARVLVPALLK